MKHIHTKSGIKKQLGFLKNYYCLAAKRFNCFFDKNYRNPCCPVFSNTLSNLSFKFPT